MATGVPAFMQSKITTRSSEHGNFELLAWEGNQVVHYWRDNSKSDFRWYRAEVVSQQATGNPWFIQNSMSAGGQGNFEAVILEGNQLVHYIRDNSRSDFLWQRGQVVSSQATGQGWIIQSDFGGNFEVVVPEGNQLVHYWCDNSKPNAPWNRGEVITNQATGPACFLQSDFRMGSSQHGNMELMVLEGSNLVHYWHDSGNMKAPWQRAEVISSQATGPACFIQSNQRTGSSEHGNFELVVLEGSDLVRYWHDSSNMKSPWQRGEVITSRATGPGCIIQSDFGNNFEVVVPEGNELAHYWHDSSNMNSPWQRSEVIAAR
jgi:hypothetical protein